MIPKINMAATAQDGANDPLSIAVELRDAAVLAMVRDALEQNRTFLAFQPVVQAARPDQVAFFEGLIRICDLSGRVIPAAQFMAAVETDEIGRLVDCQALRLGLLALRQNPNMRLSINMSARSIGYRKWMQVLKTGLKADPTLAERLILEITERSAIVIPDLVQAFMSDLQNRGVAFALDDFGAGYTSFRYLRDFYFDMVKIDGQFVRGIAADPDNRVLVGAMLGLARHFEMFVVAEHVENAADARVLQDMGIDCLQGHLYGVPSARPAWPHQRARADHPA